MVGSLAVGINLWNLWDSTFPTSLACLWFSIFKKDYAVVKKDKKPIRFMA